MGGMEAGAVQESEVFGGTGKGFLVRERAEIA